MYLDKKSTWNYGFSRTDHGAVATTEDTEVMSYVFFPGVWML